MPDDTTLHDPFAPADNAVARLAARVGRTEGSLYSLAIGALALWAVAANTFGAVSWHATTAPSSPFALSGQQPPVVQVPAVSAPPLAPLPPLPLQGPVSLGELAGGTPSAATSAPEPMFSTPPSSSPVGTLRVTGGGYAAADAGTPLATAGIPTGSVAVGSRAGQVDKVAYLHVSGDPGVFHLKVNADGANVLDQNASLLACPVQDAGWTVGHGDVTPATAPKYSCVISAPGTRSSDGTTWMFDVSSIDVSNGVALVPDVSLTGVTVPAVGLTDVRKSFQVVFSLTP